ncbi:hypothetical protein ACFFW8_11790 [Erwinia tracheiphila]
MSNLPLICMPPLRCWQRQKQQYDRSIPDAIKKMMAKTYTGLSPDSLRVYITAFGYENRYR